MPMHDAEIERAVIAACLITEGCYDTLASIIKNPEVFFEELHQCTWLAMQAITQRGSVIDLLTVVQELPKHGYEHEDRFHKLADISTKVSSNAHAEHHATILVGLWMQRSLAPIGHDLVSTSFDAQADVLAAIDRGRLQLDGLIDQVDNVRDRSTSQLLSMLLTDVQRISESDGALVGIDTGFRGLNTLTGGWQAGDLIIVGARPGMGKTAFAIRQMIAAANAGHGVAFFSYEMTPEQLMKRVVSNESEHIHANMLFKHGIHKQHQWDQLYEVIGKVERMGDHIHVLQRFGDVNELTTAVRRYRRKHSIGLVIVDYLQLISPPRGMGNGTREQEVSYTSRQLKRMAQEQGVAVIALSQLSRKVEERSDKRPRLADLRESGAIEQDADVIGFLYRDNYYNGNAPADQADILIAKQRNGSQDVVTVGYDANHVRFFDFPQTSTPYTNEDQF